MQGKPKVIIIGAGFAGLRAARKLSREDVDIVLIDRNNYHTFKPLLYQVATSGLDPSAVAYPIRSIFRRNDNVRFLMGEVTAIEPDRQIVTVASNGDDAHEEAYDYLLVAAGSRVNYFGQDDLQAHSFGLNDLQDAIRIRHHILGLFERAAWEQDAGVRDALLTMVVVGGGPTGLETAGALYELYNNVIDAEFDKDNTMEARVILLEARDSLLAPYPDKLQRSAVKQLESLGVEVRLGAMVDSVTSGELRLKDGSSIATYTVVWAAGVKASSVGEMLGVELMRGGKVPVEQDLRVIGLENVYVAGDLAYLTPPDSDEPYAGVIPVANQQGELVAKNVIHQLRGEPLETFAYFDKGIMATIGRSRAVAWVFNRIQLSGILAWWAWLGLHLVMLMGFRNQVQVFVNWVWQYITYDRSVRLILHPRLSQLPDEVRERGTTEDHEERVAEPEMML